MNTTSEMQLIPIDKLIPYVNNARTHSAEQLNKHINHYISALYLPATEYAVTIVMPENIAPDEMKGADDYVQQR